MCVFPYSAYFPAVEVGSSSRMYRYPPEPPPGPTSAERVPESPACSRDLGSTVDDAVTGTGLGLQRPFGFVQHSLAASGKAEASLSNTVSNHLD